VSEALTSDDALLLFAAVAVVLVFTAVRIGRSMRRRRRSARPSRDRLG
jgi:hypothetical protein